MQREEEPARRSRRPEVPLRPIPIPGSPALGFLALMSGCLPYEPGDSDTNAPTDTDAAPTTETWTGTAELRTQLAFVSNPVCSAPMELTVDTTTGAISGWIDGDCPEVVPGAQMSGTLEDDAASGDALGWIGLFQDIPGTWQATRTGPILEGEIDCQDEFAHLWGTFTLSR